MRVFYLSRNWEEVEQLRNIFEVEVIGFVIFLDLRVEKKKEMRNDRVSFSLGE